MRNQLSKIVLIAAAVILSAVFLYPTYQDYHFHKALVSLTGKDSLDYYDKNQDDIRSAKEKRIKLGLDLQGGMRVVLEVNVIRLLEDIAKNKDENFQAIMTEFKSQASANEESLIPTFTKKFTDRGIRLSRYYGNIRDADDAITKNLQSETEKSIDRAIEIVRNRVDQYGVSEPAIQKQGAGRIIVELPGVKDEAEVRSLLQGTAKLDFRLVRDPEISFKVMQSIDNFLSGKIEGDTTASKAAKKKEEKPKDALQELLGGTQTATSDTSKEAQFMKEHPFFSYVLRDPRQGGGDGFVEDRNRDRVARLLARPDVQKLFPADFDFLWSAKTEKMADGRKFYRLHPVKKNVELSGNVITGARASIDPQDNRPVVDMEMNSEGAREWARITGANINKQIAIVLDNAVFSAPYVRGKIPSGRSQISNIESSNEARLLEIVLKAGALPAPVAIVEQRTVGPSLGEDSIKSGLSASALAFIFTVLFMVVYYKMGGAIADFALLFNVLFLLGVLAGFQATLTLPGIAGIILTMAIAVDANVLIYERIREELQGGKTLRAAIDAGYAKAFTAIFDSNLTTFLTGVILYQFGTGPIQGFALTLMIGIVASMFSAIVITRVIFNMMTDKGATPSFG